MSDILLIKGKILIDISDIKEVSGLEYVGEPDAELTGKYIVRVFSRTPFIDIVHDTLEQAQTTYRNISKQRRVVNINEMRYGKW